MCDTDKIDNVEKDISFSLFCQLNQFEASTSGLGKWYESSRWVKFEEVVENTREHWSKPHVGILYLNSIFELKKIIENSVISFNHEGENLEDIINSILTLAVEQKKLEPLNRIELKQLLHMNHYNPHHNTRHIKGVLGSQNSLLRLLLDSNEKNKGKLNNNPTDDQNNEETISLMERKFCSRFKKKIPLGSEVVNILVAETPVISENLCLFIHLRQSFIIGAYSEVNLPTRFVIYLLGPLGNLNILHECGRVAGSLFADSIFRKSAYTATTIEDISLAIDEFVNSALIIPPDEWNPETKIDPPKENIPERQAFQSMEAFPNVDNDSKSDNEQADDDSDSGLKRTGRLFGGFIDDFKRKRVFYRSDFRDALDLQCLASFIFLFFACLAPIITFGGLLLKATDGYLGAMESILAAAIAGILYSLLAGQPLTILGTTGPLLIFESIVFKICSSYKWDFLSFRLWIGIWIMLMLFVVVAFDLSFLVKYFTKFTEECFAMLISLIYIVNSFQKLFELLEDYPINRNWSPNYVLNRTCSCMPPNASVLAMFNEDHTRRLLTFEKPPLLPTYLQNLNVSILNFIDWENITDGYFSWDTHNYKQICVDYGGTWIGNTCGKLYIPDIFYFSWILMLGTFSMAYGLKIFRNSNMLPSKVREIIGTFSVVIAIFIFTLLDFLIGMNTPKLIVPKKFEPTLGYKIRTWIVPILGNNPWWTTLLAFIPATLALILIFMDQQITVIIVNRKSNKLKKGFGYHLDIFVIALLIGIHSLLGIPWFVGSTVLAMNHVMSLKLESSNNVPGVPPEFLGCKEQRLTHFMISLGIGLSIFLTTVLQRIPMPVLYGVFFYMGVSPLSEIDMVQRVRLFFINAKKRPDYKYLQSIPIRRVHLFTSIQVICLTLLYTIKSVKILSVIFPLMVLAVCFVRKSLECIFTREELKWLDQVFPLNKSKEKTCKRRLEDCIKRKKIKKKNFKTMNLDDIQYADA